MRKLSNTLLYPLLTAAFVHAQQPVAHWSFDHGYPGFYATDETGNGYDLVALHKAGALASIDAVVGKGLKFNAPGFELEARGSAGVFNFPQLTLETIVLDPGTGGAIFSCTKFQPGVAQGYWLGIWPGSTLNFVTGNDQNFQKWNETRSTISLTPGKVFHVAAVMNDNGWNKVYIDGNQVGQQPFVPYLPFEGRSLVGYKYGDGTLNSYLTSGAVDELKLYDRVLTADEIRAHYLEVKAAIDSLNAQ